MPILLYLYFDIISLYSATKIDQTDTGDYQGEMLF